MNETPETLRSMPDNFGELTVARWRKLKDEAAAHVAAWEADIESKEGLRRKNTLLRADRDALRESLEKAENGLAAQMYRERLTDLNTDSGEWPKGVIANLGELDYQAEKLVRKAWGNLSRERQAELMRATEDSLASLPPDPAGVPGVEEKSYPADCTKHIGEPWPCMKCGAEKSET